MTVTEQPTNFTQQCNYPMLVKSNRKLYTLAVDEEIQHQLLRHLYHLESEHQMPAKEIKLDVKCKCSISKTKPKLL